MNALFQKIKNFFAKIWQSIKNFFSAVSKKWNAFLVTLGTKLLKLRDKICSIFKRKNPEQKSRNKQSATESATYGQAFQTENTTAGQNEAPLPEKPNQTETTDTASAPAPQNQKPASRLSVITGTIFDVFTDLLFGFALMLRLKPDIFCGINIFAFEFPEDSKILVFINSIGEPLNLSELAENYPSFLAAFLGILIIYFVFKLIFSFFITKSPQKLLSALLVFIGILTVSLVLDKFLLFLMFYILLYFAHQLSCKIAPKTAAIKLGTIILLNIILYVTLHFAFNTELLESLKSILQTLELPIKGLI